MTRKLYFSHNSAFHGRLLPRLHTVFLPVFRSILSISLAFSLFSAQWDMPSFASPAPVSEKKPKVDSVLNGLPISELSTDEAIFHAMNRLAYVLARAISIV